jgi:50S ribosomal protein L16 3-hydroxylase
MKQPVTNRDRRSRAELRKRAAGTAAPRIARTRPARAASRADAAAPPTGLTLLLGTMRRTFLTGHWPSRPFVYHGRLARLARLTQLDALRSAADLLAARAAAFQDLTVYDNHELAPKYMAPREAIHFYQRGDLLSIPQLHTTIPALRQIIAELAGDLGEPPQHFTCNAFVAAGEHGAFMHYDASLTFNLQLKGEKVWRIAPNHHVENPLIASDTRDDHLPPFASGPFPRTMPADAMTFRVKPGSLVFVPRGYWHETDTFGESLAVTFSLVPPTWSHRVLHALERRLDPHTAWRGYPLAAGGLAPRDALARELAGLLPQLREIIDELEPSSVVDAPISSRCFRWPAGARPTVVVVRRTPHVLRGARTGKSVDMDVDAELSPVIRWLCAQARPWSAEQMRAAWPSLAQGYTDAILAALAAQGFIESV